jgi:hypothetical protein
MLAMEPGRIHRKRWPSSVGTHGRVQSDHPAAMVGIRSDEVEVRHLGQLGQSGGRALHAAVVLGVAARLCYLFHAQ